MHINNLFAKSFSLVIYRWFAVVTILALTSLTAFGLDNNLNDMELKGSVKPIPKTYFGMHIHRADSITDWPVVKFGTWRLWDSKDVYKRQI